MRRVFILALWLAAALTGVFLTALAPRSWLCTSTWPVDYVAWNQTTGKIVVDRAAGMRAELWTRDGDRPELPYQLQVHIATLMKGTFAPDGSTALTGGNDGTIILWDVQSGLLRHKWHGDSGALYSVAYSPDGKTVLTGSYDGTAMLRDVQTGTLLHKLEGHAKAVMDVAFAPDGNTVLTANEDGTAMLWDAHSGALLRTLQADAGKLL